MADTPTPIGTFNLWHRSTDVTTLLEDPMKYVLSRLYDTDAEAGYFIFGTAAHLYASERLEGVAQEEAWNIAAMNLADAWQAAESAGKEIRWTKKRPGDEAFTLLLELCQKWEADYEGFYGHLKVVAVEHQTTATLPDGTPIATTLDAVFMDELNGTYEIVDWKFGATAKANPVQLQIYGWAARHCPESPVYHVPPEYVTLKFHHAAFSKQQEVPFMPDPYIVGLLDWATRQKRDILDSGFAPAKPDWYCDYCLYKSNCPAFEGDIRDITLLLQSAGVEERPEG